MFGLLINREEIVTQFWDKSTFVPSAICNDRFKDGAY